jgi:hypothetical protein
VGGQTKTSFSLIRAGSGSGKPGTLDLRCLDEEVISAAALRERKEHLRDLLSNARAPLEYGAALG